MSGQGVQGRIDDHLDLLTALPGFDALDVNTKRQLSRHFDRHTCEAGAVLIKQGEKAPGLFVILKGHVSITQQAPSGTTRLNELGPGAILGEMSFVRDSGVAGATVTAEDEVEYALLEPAAFESALRANPDLATAIAHTSSFRHRANLLAHIFHSLDPTSRQTLADSIKAIDVDQGQIIVRQGEPGKRAYVLADGTANVILESATAENRLLATLQPGTLIGEASLLTDAPRDASVVMATPGRVLALSRNDLLTAAGNDGKVSAELVSLLRMRWRPKQRPGIEVSERSTPEGDTIVILKDPARNAYYRMASDGAYIWEHLDGATTLRDISMGYLQRFGEFAPERVAQAVHDLVDEGFATTADVTSDVADVEVNSGASALAIRALSAMAWTKGVSDVDRWFDRLYSTFGFLFNKVAVAVLSLVALVGVVVAFIAGPRSGDFITEAGGAVVLLGLIPANAIGAVCHEAAHGMSVKHFGRNVSRAGVGWYLITPVAFVDTSDMWLEDRGKRVLVSAAGPFANLVIGGIAAIGAATLTSPLVVAILWQFVITSYYLALINLNPLLEFDGYYMLSDALDRPNLRDEALRWIGSQLPSALRNTSKLKGHRVDVIYGFLAVGYIVLVGFFMLVIYRLVLQGLVANVVPDGVAAGLAWLFATFVAFIAALGTWAQMRGLNAPRH